MEDVIAGRFWEKFMEPCGINTELEHDSDSKEDLLEIEGNHEAGFLSPDDSSFDIFRSDDEDSQLERLPTGKTESRLLKENFQNIHDSAGRIKETYYN